MPFHLKEGKTFEWMWATYTDMFCEHILLIWDEDSCNGLELPQLGCPVGSQDQCYNLLMNGIY